MTRAHLTFSLLALALTACQDKDNDLPGDQDLAVYATITDPVSGPGTTEPFASQPVFIADVDNANNFLYSANTNADGYVLFKGLLAGKEYRVYASQTLNNLVFAASATAMGNAGRLDLPLVPGGNGQNGFLITCNSAVGGPLAGLPVSVFASEALAVQNVATNAVHSAPTDVYGRVLKLAIPEATYYARIKSNDLFLDTIVSFAVAADGIATPTFTLTTGAATGFKLFCTDTLGAGLPGLTVCGFTSLPLANQGDCALGSFPCSPLGSGLYGAVGLAPMTYHLLIQSEALELDTVVPITVLPQEIVQDTVELAF